MLPSRNKVVRKVLLVTDENKMKTTYSFLPIKI